MAVVSSNPIPDSQTGTKTRDGWRYSCQYQVETDDVNDGQKTVVDGCGVSLGASFSFGNDSDSNSLCVSIVPNRVDGNRKLWVVTCNYEPNGGKEGKPDGDGNPSLDPREWADDIDLGWTSVSEAVWRAKYKGYIKGDGDLQANAMTAGLREDGTVVTRSVDSWGPCHNSAGDVFDPPPEQQHHIRIVNITRYLPAFPEADALAYQNAINSDQFTYKNAVARYTATWKKGAVRCEGITGSWDLATIGDDRFVYWTVNYSLLIDGRGWDLRLLDFGYSNFEEDNDGLYKAERKDRDEVPSRMPVPLAGNGRHAPDQPPTWLVFESEDVLTMPFANLLTRPRQWAI